MAKNISEMLRLLCDVGMTDVLEDLGQPWREATVYGLTAGLRGTNETIPLQMDNGFIFRAAYTKARNSLTWMSQRLETQVLKSDLDLRHEDCLYGNY